MWKKWILILGAIAALLWLVILSRIHSGYTLVSMEPNFHYVEGVNLTLKIIVDDEDPRIGEDLNFTIEGIGEGSIPVWDFGDGTGSRGVKVNHTYLSSDYYYVDVICVDRNGTLEGSGRTTVPVKVPDIHHLSENGSAFYDLSRGRSGYGFSILLYPGITDPEVDVLVNITQATGIVGAQVGILNETDDALFDQGPDRLVLGSVEYRFQISAEDYEEHVNEPTEIEMFAELYEGRCASFKIEARVTY